MGGLGYQAPKDQLVSPTMACGTALHELLNVLETNPDDDGQELLVSQVR